MRKVLSVLLVLVLSITIAAFSIKAYFSPNESPEAAVIEQIDKANITIYVQAYLFTSKGIADALIRASKRAVRIAIIVDKSQPVDGVVKNCLDSGCKIFIDRKHAIAHNKIIIIDSKIVITGSYNWTESAEHRNAENLLIIDSVGSDLADEYLRNWQNHVEHSEEVRE